MSDAATPRPVGHHARAIEDVVVDLATDPVRGLASSEVARRWERYGPNELRPGVKTSPWKLFLSQYNDFMIWVLLAAVVFSAFEGQTADALAIVFVLLLNGLLGFVQEYRAEQALDALKQMAAPLATVLRDGRELDVPAVELVPGDVVLLEAGDRVPADARLLQVAVLRMEEAALTGESRAVSKVVEPISDPEAALGDRRNTVFAGTSVAVGHGRAVVTETGQSTEMGEIADLLAQQEDDRTPLEIELKRVGQVIAGLVLAACAIVFGIEVWRALIASGLPLLDALRTGAVQLSISTALLVAISLAVAAIPEGLPAIVTVSLSLGVRRMAAHHAIVRRLHAVETLGSTSFICSDKTGTLTRNEMTVRRILVGLDAAEISPDFALLPESSEPAHADRELLFEIATSCNDARFGAGDQLIGDPTETALLVAARRLSSDPVRRPRVGEVPFDSARKRMTTVHDIGGSRVAHMKGGGGVVFALCTSALLHGAVMPMTDDLRAELHRRNAALASAGYRTLAFATRELGDADTALDESIERDMTYVGVMGLLDPPRAEVPAAIAECHRAGIQVAMVTGDHALTARAVADEIGLLEGERILTGAEIAAMTDADLCEAAEHVRVYARVDPEHKLRIVDALKRRGHIVAMTGDGVNDAPALKKADIGVAMGRIGTDVSREAADMVLADDDFATIVEAVREGRVVFDNLRKSILFLVSCNISEVAIVFTTSLLVSAPALLPLQLLWINLVTDGLPALALGVDPGSPHVMDRPPRSRNEAVLSRRTLSRVVAQGAVITVFALALYLGVRSGIVPADSAAHAQTMLFTTIVLTQLLHAFDFRSSTRTVFSVESARNLWLVIALVGSMLLHAVVIYLPAAQTLFHTQPLGALDWVVVLLASLAPIVVLDLLKVLGARSSRR
jgi:Ca2+-transporting ATPase